MKINLILIRIMLFILKLNIITCLKSNLKNIRLKSSSILYNNNNNNQQQQSILPGIFFILGGPGSGKGTQAELLSKEFKLSHISAGELLRREIKKKSKYSDIITKVLSEGLIVPAEITIDILKEEVQEQAKNSKNLVIDGFPRNEDNLNWWLKKMSNVCNVDQLIHLDCSSDELKRRLQLRGRSDDTEEIINTRIKNHERESKPVLKYFKQQNLVTHIDAEKSKEEVYRNLRKKILPYIRN